MTADDYLTHTMTANKQGRY